MNGSPHWIGSIAALTAVAGAVGPSASAVQDCAISVQFAEDFSSGGLPAGWTATGLWHVTQACAPVDTCIEGAFAYWGVDSQCNYKDAVLSGSLTGPWFNIPALPQGGVTWVQFCVDLDWEGSPETVGVYLERSDGSRLIAYAPDSGSNSTQVSFMLLGVPSGPARFVCEFDAYDYWANEYGGVKLDSFRVLTFEGGLADCNGNLSPDVCDIAKGLSADCNGDGVPDECQGIIYSTCTSSPNSVGSGARLSPSGAPIVSCNRFAIQVDGGPPGEVGVLAFSTDFVPATPFGAGVLCLPPWFFHLPKGVVFDASGACRLDLDLKDMPVLGQIKHQQTLHFQLLYRDRNGVGAGFNTTDVLTT